MAKHDYYIFTIPVRPDHGYVTKDPKGASDTFLVDQGKPFAGHLPPEASVELDPKHKGMKLADFISNCMSWLIVSEKAKEILTAEPNPCEVYPLKVMDLKGRPVKDLYFLVHPVGTVRCVDLDRSKYERDAMDPDLLLAIERLVLDPGRIPPDRSFFRLQESPRTYIIRDDLLDKLADAQVKGPKVLDLDTPVFI
jgi:hypothetical protein